MKLHGGTIEVTSQVGQGTAFRVGIPFGTAHLPHGRVREPRALSSTAVGAETYVQEALRWLEDPTDNLPTRPDAQPDNPLLPRFPDRRFAATFGSRIVLADDNADVRRYVRDLLAPYYVVETVADGEQALEAARRLSPDLVLTDVMMPTSGRLRASSQNP